MDLPQTETEVAADPPNPLLATLEAMQRLKKLNEELMLRINILEAAWAKAFSKGSQSFEALLLELDVNLAKNPVVIEGESKEVEKGENED